MKKVLLILMCVLLAVSFVGCQKAPSPTDTVTKLLDAMQAYDLEALAEYVDEDEMYAMAGYSEEEMDLAVSIITTMFENLSYEVVSESVDGDTAIVIINVTNVDMSVVFTDMLTKMIGLAFDPTYQNASEEEQAQIGIDLMLESIEGNSDTLTTNQVTVTLTKADGKWQIVNIDDLLDAAMGGIGTAFEDMN